MKTRHVVVNPPKKNTTRGERLALAIALTAGATLAVAVHDQEGVELDRDAVDSNGGPQG